MEKSTSKQKIEKNSRKDLATITARDLAIDPGVHKTNGPTGDYFDSFRQERSQETDVQPLACLNLDENGCVKNANITAAQMLGVQERDLINSHFIDFIHKKDKNKLRLEQNHLSGLASQSLKIRLKNGKGFFWAWVNVSSDDVFYFSNRQIRLTLNDISEINQIEQENLKLKHQILQSQKMEAIGELSTGIAHDFNNILHPILGSLEILIEDTAGETKNQKALKNILKGAKRAKRLVKQILSYGHQENFEVGPIKIQHVVREVLKLCRSSLPANIKIVQTIDNGCGQVMADATNIYQIAMNLITNAAHAMEHDGGVLNVTLSEIQVTADTPEIHLIPGLYTCLTVADTGKGIETSIKNKIFEPHFTTKGTGTGLGLSVISGIVKKYGGDICFSSEPEKGSIFQVYIPRSYIPLDSPTFKYNKQKDLYGYESILFVDDDPFIANFQQTMLNRYGYNVKHFTKSIDALEEFKATPGAFDLAICDMTMPVMNGLTLALQIKQINSNVPVIIFTGYSNQINKENYRDMGIDGYLMKPIKNVECLKMIRELLDKKRQYSM